MTALAGRPPTQRLSPAGWMRANLFSNAFNSIITIIVGLILTHLLLIDLLALVRGGLKVGGVTGWLINTDFDILRANLRLFVIGTEYPRDQLWRPVVSGWLAVATMGLVSGALFRAATDTAVEADIDPPESSPLDMVRRFWPALAVVVLLLALTTTITPTLIVIAGAILMVAGRSLGLRLPAVLRGYVWFFVLFGLGGYVSIMTGEPTIIVALLAALLAASLALRFAPLTFPAVLRAPLVAIAGLAIVWVGATIGLGGWIGGLPNAVLGIFGASSGLAIHPIAVLAVVLVLLAGIVALAFHNADAGDGLARTAVAIIAAAIGFLIGRFIGNLLDTRTEIGVGGAGWDDWGGLHLNLLVAVVGIVVAFPFGLLLALGRRTSKDRSDIRVTSGFAVGGAVVGAVLAAIFFGTAATVRPLGIVDIPFAMLVGAVAGAAIGAGIPLSRQSNLPVFWGLSVTFIEFIRGVPLITLLFFGDKMLRFFFPKGWEPPSTVSRAMIVITMFSAAYIAEIVRGGLQAVPKGQIEAAQAVGLPAPKALRLIVLPQALRAVIPAMVGQAISLWKDTSLLSFISLVEILKVSEIANAQPDFRGESLSDVTLLFVAFLFWAPAYAMSRESQRLETKLSVGAQR